MNPADRSAPSSITALTSMTREQLVYALSTMLCSSSQDVADATAAAISKARSEYPAGDPR